ncbi:hypothetical protein A2110_02060 [Candidatus Jorgensenbacteria bacterium GWA1_54_12]|uniref:LamG-like jellyroll fold domain-containing protein n=1 Tax=Candidatus Jorgensenbacteria bacterium GWA1_54_12 TaxID=1798468 RepID=A0A1F6BLJ8_9BACT|nr:MAG: hypothetical protein A2110_02060 [Candidatus Jorgensenbacteria bacterium GWA1_54_12]
MPHTTSRNAFSLIEILVVVALGAILTTGSFFVLSGPKQKRDVELSAKELAAVIREARTRSITQEDSSRWGIYLMSSSTGTDSYLVYTGAAYAPGGVKNTHYFRRRVEFGEPAEGRATDIAFDPVTGEAGFNKAFTIVHQSNIGIMGEVVVGSLGRVSVRTEHGVGGVWHFDEGAGTSAYDNSGNGNAGTLEGSPTWAATSTCRAGRCLSFDGSDDNVAVTDSSTVDPTAAWTLSAWIRRGTTGVQHSIVEKYDWTADKGNYGMRIGADNKLTAFVVSGGDINDCGATLTTIAADTWYHVAATFDSVTDTLVCYVNGVAEATNGAATIDPPDSTVSMKIGCRGNDCASRFNGEIDAVRIYNRALSGEEIKAHYNDLR